ncbi:hypothetical protein B0H10DRAFT_1786698 [Mycena sp. CBHHK59/15]|nr:hypothetical protein B0H10DRAFT_1786698 [Mycena sp. CBHHK59/15]
MGPDTRDDDKLKNSLPMLSDDSKNWIHYEEQIRTYTTSKGLGRHLTGMVCKPADLVQDATGDWVIAGVNIALTEEQLEAHKKKIEDYETKEAKLRHIIYQTISQTCFNQVKSEATAATVWTKLTQINQNHGDMIQMNMLIEFQQMRCANDDNDDYVLFIGVNDNDNNCDNVVLAVSPNFREEAHAATKSTACNMIIDSSTTCHFSPDRENFTNFLEIPPIPIHAADSCTFSAIGKGDYKTQFPMGAKQKPTRVVLQNTYYAPNMAFTLISVSTLNHAGYSLHIKDASCAINTLKPQRRMIT